MLYSSSDCIANSILFLHTTLLSVTHVNLLYNTTTSLGYMFRLFSVIIRPYLEQVQGLSNTSCTLGSQALTYDLITVHINS